MNEQIYAKIYTFYRNGLDNISAKYPRNLMNDLFLETFKINDKIIDSAIKGELNAKFKG